MKAINNVFHKNIFAIAVYRKKPIFGGVTIELLDNHLVSNHFDFVKDNFSNIIEGDKKFQIILINFYLSLKKK